MRLRGFREFALRMTDAKVLEEILAMAEELEIGTAWKAGQSAPDRFSPRLRGVARSYHEVGPVGAALRAAKLQLGQRHVAAPSLHERIEVGAAGGA